MRDAASYMHGRGGPLAYIGVCPGGERMRSPVPNRGSAAGERRGHGVGVCMAVGEKQ